MCERAFDKIDDLNDDIKQLNKQLLAAEEQNKDLQKFLDEKDETTTVNLAMQKVENKKLKILLRKAKAETNKCIRQKAPIHATKMARILDGVAPWPSAKVEDLKKVIRDLLDIRIGFSGGDLHINAPIPEPLYLKDIELDVVVEAEELLKD